MRRRNYWIVERREENGSWRSPGEDDDYGPVLHKSLRRAEIDAFCRSGPARIVKVRLEKA